MIVMWQMELTSGLPDFPGHPEHVFFFYYKHLGHYDPVWWWFLFFLYLTACRLMSIYFVFIIIFPGITTKYELILFN